MSQRDVGQAVQWKPPDFLKNFPVLFLATVVAIVWGAGLGEDAPRRAPGGPTVIEAPVDGGHYPETAHD